jgi:hypothetical protein
MPFDCSQNWYFSQIALTNRIHLFKGYIQIYPVSEGYLRKIPVERRGKYLESGEGHLTVLKTGIIKNNILLVRVICIKYRFRGQSNVPSKLVFFANSPH